MPSVVFGGVLLLGCATQNSETPRSIVAPNPVVSPLPVAPPWYPAIQLPRAVRNVSIPNEAYPIFIDDHRAYVGLPAVAVAELPPRELRGPHGFGEEKKPTPGDGFVSPLADAVERRPCGPSGSVPDAAVVYASASLEYRVVVDALFTLSRLGYKRLFLATNSAPPDLSRVGIVAPGGSDYSLAVFVGAADFAFSKLVNGDQPLSCPAGTQPAPPDLAALQSCVQALAPPGSTLYLSPDGQLPLQTVISTAEAMNGERRVVFAFPTPRNTAGDRAALSGTISNASRVVAAMRAPFRRCYNDELARVANAEGKLRISLRVGPDGSVTAVTVTVTGNLGGAVECARRVAMAAKFDPPDGGSAVVVVPVTFVKTDERPKPDTPRCGLR